ncbi:hypothetical protein CRENBAI_023633 [Crenichthys baileyi]|uniref:Uncharacterized protein n=1 Tax=Crenichthys baileyi TaxID=28760 RepID=A0AAV9S9R6_9TELE
MQDTFNLSVKAKFNFRAEAGQERGLQLLTSTAADMKSAEEAKTESCDLCIVGCRIANLTRSCA